MIPRDWNVLIIEDEEDMRQIMRMLLEATYGCKVFEAANSHDLQISLSTATPNLVFLDLGLGKETGEQLARQLRTYPPTAEVPIIVLSEHCWSQNRRLSALDAGCDYCLDKADLFPNFKESIDKAMTGLT